MKKKTLLDKFLESETLKDCVLNTHHNKKRFLFKGTGPYMNTRYEIYSRDSICVDGYSMEIWFSDYERACEWFVRNYDSKDHDEWSKERRERDRLLYAEKVMAGEIDPDSDELPWF